MIDKPQDPDQKLEQATKDKISARRIKHEHDRERQQKIKKVRKLVAAARGDDVDTTTE